MGLFDALFPRRVKAAEAQSGRTVSKLSLQLLFPLLPNLDSASLTKSLRRYHRSTTSATFDVNPESMAHGTPVAQARWGRHVIDVVGLDAPMPSSAVEFCVAPAHYAQQMKAKARSHKAHIILFYGGSEPDPFEQYAALAVVAGTLASHGALIVCNGSARTSLPASILSVDKAPDMLAIVRVLPIPLLFAGFVKLDVENVPGVWMRTYGCHLLNLPDLAAHAQDHSEGQRTLECFSNILNYLRESRAKIAPGHTMQVGENLFMKARAPRRDEPWLENPGPLLVAEFISPQQINP